MLSIYNFLKVKLCYRTYWKQWLAFLTLCFLVFACSGGDGGSDDSNNPCPNQPQLTTLEVSNISIDENTDLASATFSGEIQNIQLGANCETFSITNQGFVYSTNIQPTTSDNVVNANGENASANVSDLMAETTYYVRAYLTNTLGTFYGNEVSFTTPELNPLFLDENGVTIKAKDWSVIGDVGEINGIEYTIVDESQLRQMVLDGENVTNVCTTKVNQMDFLFNEIEFNEDISSWDVSNVENMFAMFTRSNFNQDLNYWDVSNVTNMSSMFRETPFNQYIGDWNVSNVTNMTAMFFMSPSFNQDISSWDVSNVTEMTWMFQGNNNEGILNQFNQDISSWDVSNVTNMNGMFAASTFNQDLSSWNVHNVTICYGFCLWTTNYTLPKPNFIYCNDDIGCD